MPQGALEWATEARMLAVSGERAVATAQRCGGASDADKALAARLHFGTAVLCCRQQSEHVDLERTIHLSWGILMRHTS